MHKEPRVYYHKRLKKWMVMLRIDKRDYHVGYFTYRIDGIIERNVVLNKLFGDGGFATYMVKEKPLGSFSSKRKRVTKLEAFVSQKMKEETSDDSKFLNISKNLKKERPVSIDDILP
jgi:hypothetical protein